MKQILTIGCALILSFAFAADPKGDAKAGKTLFEANCAGCHGASAEGSFGPKLAGTASKWSFTLFKRALTKGVNNKGKKLDEAMPRFKLTDKEIASIQAHLKTIK